MHTAGDHSRGSKQQDEHAKQRSSIAGAHLVGSKKEGRSPRQKGIEYQEIPVDGDPTTRQQMAERAGQTSVPQIWIGEQHIGGCDQLYGLERSGGLDPLLA